MNQSNKTTACQVNI